MARNFATTNNLSFGDLTIFDGLGAISCAMWINPDALTNDARFVGKGGADAGSQSILFTMDTAANGQARIVISDGVSRWVADTGDSVIATGAWEHLAYVCSGGDSGAIYKNAVSQTLTNVIAQTPSTINNTARLFRIGADEDTAGIDGNIAEVSLWNRALSLAEVEIAYRAGPWAVPKGLLMYVPIFGIVSPESDFSGNNNHGTVTGTTRIDHPPGISAVWLAPHPRRSHMTAAAVANPAYQPWYHRAPVLAQ